MVLELIATGILIGLGGILAAVPLTLLLWKKVLVPWIKADLRAWADSMLPDDPQNEAADPLMKKAVSYIGAYTSKAMYAAFGTMVKKAEGEVAELLEKGGPNVGPQGFEALGELFGTGKGKNETGVGGIAAMMKLMQTFGQSGGGGHTGGGSSGSNSGPGLSA